jgi:hypothetical protein
MHAYKDAIRRTAGAYVLYPGTEKSHPFKGFQQTGCTTNECIVEVGKLIGVEKIIGGSISQVGNIFSISSRIVNVETGEIENTGVFDHIGNIGQLLTEGMRIVAVDLIE